MPKIMLIDGNSILNRAFYGLSGVQMLSTKDGLFTNAVYGFINILNKFIEEQKPEYICVAFDKKAPTFRNIEYTEYKANRHGMPEELAMQVPLIKEVLDAMGIKRIEQEGFEADDIIGSLSHFSGEKGIEVEIVTGDRDSLQLVDDMTKVLLISTRKGKTETNIYNVEAIKEKYGVEPAQLKDVKGLMGDSSDNIPGVPGVGEKTALKLIIEYGSIEKIYENIDEIKTQKLKEKLVENKDMAFLSKRLGTIIKDMTLDISIDELSLKDIKNEKVFNIFKKLEFESLIKRFGLDRAQQDSFLSKKGEEIIIIEDKEDLSNLKKEIIEKREICVYHLIDKLDSIYSSLIGLGLCVDNKPYYINLNNIEEDFFVNDFKEIFENKEIKKYAYHSKDFITILKKHGVDFNGLEFDVMIAEYIIDPSKEKYFLSQIAQKYLNTYIKDI